MVVKFKNKADTGSNKPGSYAVQLTAKAYSYLRPTKFKVAVLKPKIDRLAVTFPIPDGQTKKKIRDNLESLADGPGCPSVMKWQKIKDWGASRYTLSYGVDVGPGKRVLVQCTKGNTGVAFLRIEFNPDQLGLDGVMKFRDLLPEIMCGEVTYKNLASVGKVTRLDIAVDLVNIDLEDLLVTTSKPGVSIGYFGLSGKAETKYLNVNKKGSNLYVYDRKTRLQKLQEEGIGAGSVFGDTKYTRVEVRTTSEKPIIALPGFQNRLKRIDLIDIEAAEPPEGEHHWKLFQDSCRYRGLAGALNLLPDGVRGLYETAVKAASENLWKPEKLWSLWPETVKKSGLLP